MRHGAAILGAALMLTPSIVTAQALHVFGPPGNGERRRAVVIVEAEDGSCAPFDEVDLQISESATLTLGEPEGSCARWIDVVRGTEGAPVVLRAVRGETIAEVTLEMAPAPLGVQATRTGESLHVVVPGITALEAMRAIAVWEGGSTLLERSRDAYVGRVPADAMIAVVVSAGERSGAAAVAPLVRSGHPEVLVVPSSLVVASGGSARAAAYLVVADAQARLSARVPLHVTSERGELRALDWLAPGVAAVALLAPIGVGSVDLAVTAGVTSASVDLVAGAAWPVSAIVHAPSETVRGEIARITIAARSADDAPVDPTSLVVRCGEHDVVPDGNGVALCPIMATTQAIVRAQIAGASVPLAMTTIVATEPAAAPLDAPLPETVRAEGVPPRVSGVRIAALTLGSVDLWARGTLGAGASVRARVDRIVLIDVTLRYQLTVLASPGQGMVQDALAGLAHGLEVTAGARVLPFDGVPLELLAAGGLAVSHTSATVGAASVELDELRGAILLGVGTTFRVDELSLGIDLVARGAVPLHEMAWETSWLRVGLEISGGLDLAQ